MVHNRCTIVDEEGIWIGSGCGAVELEAVKGLKAAWH